MRISYQTSLLVVLTAIVATVVSTWIGYRAARDHYLSGVDRQLSVAVAPLPDLVGEDYLTRALSNRDVSVEEYNHLVQVLSTIADRSNLFYLYIFAQDGDQVVHLATSASPDERAAADWPGFLAPYEEPPDEPLSTFVDGRTRFAEYTDEFGAFRSVFVRHLGSNGRPYVVGADVTLSQIQADLNALMLRFLTLGSLVTFLAGGLGLLLSRRLAQSLKVVTHEVDRWADREFDSDDAIRAHLQEVAASQRDEVGYLAARFSRMVESYGEISDVCTAIANGDFSRRVRSRNESDFLAEAINQVAEQRQKAAAEVKDYTTRLEQRAAMESSLSQLKSHLQGDLSLHEVATNGLNAIVSFLESPAGSLFALQSDERVHRLADHAYPEDPGLPTSYASGHGIIGQVALSGQSKIIVPGKTDMKVSYGFGKVTPSRILITPLLSNEKVVGVVELCLFHSLTDVQTQWLDQATEAVAIAVRFAQERSAG